MTSPNFDCYPMLSHHLGDINRLHRYIWQVICQSIDSLAAQSVAHRLIVVIGLEEGTPDVAEKAARWDMLGREFSKPHDRGAQKRKNWNADIHNVCIYYIIISYNVYNCRIMCIYVYIDVINVIKHIFCIIHVLCIYVRLVVSHNLFVFPTWADDPQLDWLQIRQ